MAALPTTGQANWHTPLNAFLLTSLNTDGTLVANGSGDAQSFYNATTAQLLPIKKGTAGTPDSTVNPLLKVERIIEVAETAVTGDGFENLASILGIAVGTAACETQPVGVAGAAKTSSTAAGGTAGGNDAAGLYGAGYVTGSGTGVGIGAFLSGRNDSASGKLTAVELSAYNGTGSDDTYNSAGFNDSQALWLSAGGNKVSVGFLFGKPAGRMTFDVGIAANAQNPIATTFIRDDGNSTNSLVIAGTHTTAISTAAGAGHIGFGRASSTAAQLIISADADNVTPAYLRGFSATQSVALFLVQNHDGTTTYLQVGATGTITLSDSVNSNIVVGTTTGCKIGTATGQKLAFHNSTPVIQRAGAAQVAVATTAATQTTPWGFTTQAQPDAIVTLLNEIRAALVEKGLIKGAA
jgi:alpha-D-ribose 1-methylphosphonate 5-triphosphate synthase subunit PhnH